MKLSLKKKFGWTHCRGGRVLKVIGEHRVSAKGRSLAGANDYVPEDEVFVAKPGDLVVEILYAKTGNVLGYSYLSGDAIQLNNYSLRENYEPALGRMLLPGEAPADIKDSEYDICAFEYIGDEDPASVYNSLVSSWISKPDVDNEWGTHLIGIIAEKMLFHFQPAKMAQDFCVTGFQAALLIGALKGRQ